MVHTESYLIGVDSMNGEHWAPTRSDTVACRRVATAPYGGYHKCALQHEHTHYEFSERTNVTTVHPDVVDYSQSTTVTIIGYSCCFVLSCF